MKPYANSSQNRGSVIRPILAALLMLGGIALLARAGNPGVSPASPNAVTAAPGVPRFQNYPAPAGIADDVGEPSIGCNWKSEQSFANSMFNIPNGGRVMLLAAFRPTFTAPPLTIALRRRSQTGRRNRFCSPPLRGRRAIRSSSPITTRVARLSPNSRA